ncbi:hypothetical protein TBGT1765_08991 [Thermotoga sp. TBGT1765]|nr:MULTISPECIES: hypothetical protein [unclassified Thermotoga]AIY88228.1 hypothetical protein CELL2_04625 [Thermotoga sp. Cell2]KHC90220.1 hypothetical protein TBGT1765_08991 [Thermotoga sp. TBGT1765]KHC90795.1 hypothetical protein TBGT1766_08661 [Thermotoga sp. TBGT1766]KHC96896.1 hypothetical protein XYL54_01370 [Thermotoga sp. Xyl54]
MAAFWRSSKIFAVGISIPPSSTVPSQDGTGCGSLFLEMMKRVGQVSACHGEGLNQAGLSSLS